MLEAAALLEALHGRIFCHLLQPLGAVQGANAQAQHFGREDLLILHEHLAPPPAPSRRPGPAAGGHRRRPPGISEEGAGRGREGAGLAHRTGQDRTGLTDGASEGTGCEREAASDVAARNAG